MEKSHISLIWTGWCKVYDLQTTKEVEASFFGNFDELKYRTNYAFRESCSQSNFGNVHFR